MEQPKLEHLGAEAELAPLAENRDQLAADFRAQKEIGGYFLDFSPAGDDLVISFDNADDTNPDPTRLPWGHKYLSEKGLAVLGVKTKSNDWYRGAELHAFFRSMDLHKVLATYRRVVFYGSSMGGFAALTFCTPGALVLAHNPQTNLDPALTPWDKRFPEAHQQDWSGDFARAWEGARQAERVFVTYDPFLEPDRRHVERLDPGNLVALKAPLLGHSLPSYLRRMQLLGEMVPKVLQDELTPAWWYAAVRKRRELARYLLLMSDRHRKPEGRARLLARAWHASTAERKTQDRIRRHATQSKLAELFERYLQEERWTRVVGPAGPDAELFRHFMTEFPVAGAG